ncbi:GNAT family N-acetyltransferase [Chryseobacterium sp. MFBS3-17]|uniref:GNAT family N-acetyltransferase n=1 Tax=Chryseobacterium sp. MFBS3-17 TaxID=2886689 RepID=UPI001D0F3052|nr:GNAT family N-acetyltransferase [Chryseobacterium sp. MFBS3-17]MCC2590635.1 GNAT family N-acetyltransferase [Chryseobacterium sp. MFBS3-17]
MEILKAKNIDENQFQQINDLWNEEYPINLKNRFGLLLEGVSNYNHYLIEENNQILAWAVDFEKDNETRFSIIVNKKHQRKGLGSLLIDRLKKDLGEFYGWVIDHNNDIKENGEFYQTPISFYRNNGFEVLIDERIDSEIIKAVKIKSKIKVFSETERFILREILPTDVDKLFELDSDPEVHRYLGNSPVTGKDQIIDVINFIRQQYVDNGIGRWAIIDKKTNDFIGWTGLKFVTDLTNNHKNYYDLGYRLIKKYWGQGIATETALASLNYAFDKLNADEVYAMADCENDSSNKILNKIGLSFIETFDFDGIKHNWYKIDKTEYKNKKPNR